MGNLKTIIQIRYQRWNKNQRGAQFANIRRKSPEVCPLVLKASKYKDVIVHQTDQPKQLTFEGNGCIVQLEPLNVVRHDSHLEVVGEHGKPIVTVAAEQWVQIKFNQRKVQFPHGDWYYEDNVLNLGLTVQPQADWFLSQHCEQVIDLRVDMYRQKRKGC